MRVFIICKRMKNIPHEILDYDPKTHRAVLRTLAHGILIDTNFHPQFLKRVGWTIFTDVPDCFKEPYEGPICPAHPTTCAT